MPQLYALYSDELAEVLTPVYITSTAISQVTAWKGGPQEGVEGEKKRLTRLAGGAACPIDPGRHRCFLFFLTVTPKGILPTEGMEKRRRAE